MFLTNELPSQVTGGRLGTRPGPDQRELFPSEGALFEVRGRLFKNANVAAARKPGTSDIVPIYSNIELRDLSQSPPEDSLDAFYSNCSLLGIGQRQHGQSGHILKVHSRGVLAGVKLGDGNMMNTRDVIKCKIYDAYVHVHVKDGKDDGKGKEELAHEIVFGANGVPSNPGVYFPIGSAQMDKRGYMFINIRYSGHAVKK